MWETKIESTIPNGFIHNYNLYGYPIKFQVLVKCSPQFLPLGLLWKHANTLVAGRKIALEQSCYKLETWRQGCRPCAYLKSASNGGMATLCGQASMLHPRAQSPICSGLDKRKRKKDRVIRRTSTSTMKLSALLLLLVLAIAAAIAPGAYGLQVDTKGKKVADPGRFNGVWLIGFGSF